MLAYEIAYRDRFGAHVGTKWGATPAEALALMKKAHANASRGQAEYDPPVEVQPQPFTDAARELAAFAAGRRI